MRIFNFICAAVCVCILTGCGEKNTATKSDTESSVSPTGTVSSESEYSATIEAMDTVMTLKAYGENSRKAVTEAEAEIERLDKLFRRGDSESEIYSLNANHFADVSDETAEIAKRAVEISDSTNGVFDITIAPIMDLWGFYTKNFYVPSKSETEAVLKNVGYKNIEINGNNISLKNNVQLDLGGIAKGYTSSKTADIFKENGVSGIMSLGGNVQAIGKKSDGSPWKVAVQDPDDASSYIGYLSVSDMAIITSGGYQRYFEQDGVKYHHIVDPSTGFPAESGIKSMTIVSADGTLADGLSTSLYIMGLDKGTQYWKSHDGFDFVAMTDEGKLYITEGIKDIFKSSLEYEVIYKD